MPLGALSNEYGSMLNAAGLHMTAITASTRTDHLGKG